MGTHHLNSVQRRTIHRSHGPSHRSTQLSPKENDLENVTRRCNHQQKACPPNAYQDEIAYTHKVRETKLGVRIYFGGSVCNACKTTQLLKRLSALDMNHPWRNYGTVSTIESLKLHKSNSHVHMRISKYEISSFRGMNSLRIMLQD
jgi:hypothetical protein